jgi:hypothetical protein
VEASHQLILLGSVLVLLSIFAGLFSARLGAPLLLVFLGLGMLAGGDGPGGILFRDFHAAYLIGSISLAIILFDGGLRTDPGAIRRALWPSLALATVGVIATAAIVAAAAVLLFSTSWTHGLLVGAIVAPTDDKSGLAGPPDQEKNPALPEMASVLCEVSEDHRTTDMKRRPFKSERAPSSEVDIGVRTLCRLNCIGRKNVLITRSSDIDIFANNVIRQML